MNGIQEVSGSIPLISTTDRKALFHGNRAFLFASASFYALHSTASPRKARPMGRAFLPPQPTACLRRNLPAGPPFSRCAGLSPEGAPPPSPSPALWRPFFPGQGAKTGRLRPPRFHARTSPRRCITPRSTSGPSAGTAPGSGPPRTRRPPCFRQIRRRTRRAGC